jgi:hypothetical protein
MCQLSDKLIVLLQPPARCFPTFNFKFNPYVCAGALYDDVDRITKFVLSDVKRNLLYRDEKRKKHFTLACQTCNVHFSGVEKRM